MYLGLFQRHLTEDFVQFTKLGFTSEAKSSMVSFDFQTTSSQYNGTVISENKENELYNVITESIPAGSFGNDEEMEMTYCTNKNGDYIGDLETASYLCDEKGIAPELASPNHNVCSIGFCKRERKWYGWSHRAMCGFEKGDVVYPGHCAYKASNMEEFKESLKDWYSDDMYKNLRFVQKTNGIEASYSIEGVGRNKGNVASTRHFHKFEPGKGKWCAKDMGDAKQMARDFAESVSATTSEDIELAESLISESAVQDVTKYVWFKYSESKRAMFNKHNRWNKITVEQGDVIGFKQNGRDKEAYSMIAKEDPNIVFKLNKREVARVINNSKPYRGKVLGIKVQPGSEDFVKLPASKGVARGITKRTEKLISDQNGVPKKMRQVSQDMVHACVFKADDSRRGFILGVAKTAKRAKDFAGTRVNREQPIISTMLLPKDNGIVKRALKTGWTRVSEPQASQLYALGMDRKTFNLER